jgi:hypothetical protein
VRLANGDLKMESLCVRLSIVISKKKDMSSIFNKDAHEFQRRRLELVGTTEQQIKFIQDSRDKRIYVFHGVESDLIAAAALGFVHAIKRLLPQRSHLATSFGENALWWAIKNNKPHAVNALIESGLFPVDMRFNEKDHDNTPLLLASHLRHIDVMEVLFRNGASTKNLWNWDDEPPFKIAIRDRNIKMIELLVYVYKPRDAITQIFEAVRGYPLDDDQHNIILALPTLEQRLKHIITNEEEEDVETDRRIPCGNAIPPKNHCQGNGTKSPDDPTKLCPACRSYINQANRNSRAKNIKA